jgi:hypothetical protein
LKSLIQLASFHVLAIKDEKEKIMFLPKWYLEDAKNQSSVQTNPYRNLGCNKLLPQTTNSMGFPTSKHVG